jgi:hypothetical protein
MKNVLLILALFFTIKVFSQDEKPITNGHILLGGDFNSEYSKNNNLKQFQISTSPDIGYFIVDNLAIGLNIPIIYYDIVGSSNESSIGLGPFMKYYMNNGLFFSFKLAGNIITEHYGSNTTYGISSKSLSMSPGIGYAYFIFQKTSIELGLYYEHLNTISKDTYLYNASNSSSKTNNLIFKVGFHLFL